MIDIFGVYEIRTTDEAYHICCNIDFEISDRFYGLALTIKDEVRDEYWDNDAYLWALRDLLGKKVTKQILSVSDQYELYNITEHIPEDDFQLVLDLLDKAKELGMFKEYLNSIENKIVRNEEQKT